MCENQNGAGDTRRIITEIDDVLTRMRALTAEGIEQRLEAILFEHPILVFNDDRSINISNSARNTTYDAAVALLGPLLDLEMQNGIDTD